MSIRATQRIQSAARVIRQHRLDFTLIEAARQHDTTRLAALLNAGANVNARYLPRVPEPESLADWPHYLNVTLHPPKLLVAYPTALLVAMRAEGDPTSTATLLVQRGANVNARDAQSDTALTLAGSHLTHERLTRFLLTRRADINAVNQQGESVLSQAVSNNTVSLKYINMLLAHGADVNAGSGEIYVSGCSYC